MVSRIDNTAQIASIITGDILIKYPIDAAATDSFAGRTPDNSHIYEVAAKNDITETIDLIVPDAETTEAILIAHRVEGMLHQPPALQKTYEELLSEKIWWFKKE